MMMGYVSVESRGRFLLEYIMKREDYVTLDELARHLHISKRSVYYDLIKLNHWLESTGIEAIKPERQRGILFSAEQKEQLRTYLEALDGTRHHVFYQEERMAVTLCELMLAKEVLTAEKMAKLMNVSRNTMLADIKLLKAQLLKYGLKLLYDQRKGYIVVGETIKKRAVFLYYFSQIASLARRDVLSYFNQAAVKCHHVKLMTIEKELCVQYVEGTLEQLAVLIMLIENSRESINMIDIDEREIVSHKEYDLICKYFPQLSGSEQMYMAIHLLGARVVPGKEFVACNDKPELMDLARHMVEVFENLACIKLSERQQLIKRLAKHLNCSLYRYRYGIVEGNPIAQDVQKQYTELFEITRRVAGNISKLIGYPISNSEIAYLTMYFGAYIRKTSRRRYHIKVLVVCSNGVSTVQILKSEIEQLLPLIEVVDIISIKELESYHESYDFIITTLDIDDKYPHITVRPILTWEDKKAILSYVMRTYWTNNSKAEAERFFRLVKQFVAEKFHHSLMKELKSYFEYRLPEINRITDQEKVGLTDILTPKMIKIIDKIDDWHNGIALAATPLLEEKYITKEYIDAMILCIETHGTYAFITPQVILAHARPEDGVEHLSLSMMSIRNGVKFQDNRRAKVILVLAPVDNEQHLQILKDIIVFFDHTSNIDRLTKAANEADAYSIIKNILHKH